jgi:hypothetical protein
MLVEENTEASFLWYIWRMPRYLSVCSLDLNTFRAALTILQQQVAELDRLKADYYSEVLLHEEETWDMVMGKVMVRCVNSRFSPRLM